MENEKILLIFFLPMIFVLSIFITELVYYMSLHYAKRLKKANKLLRKILTMQGCVDCQNLLPCNKHGDLVEVISEIEKFLEQKK